MKNNNFQEIFLRIFENMPEAVAVYEATDGGKDFIIKYFNKSAEKIEKIRASKTIDKKITKVFPSVKKFGILQVLRRVYKTGKAERFPLGFYKDNRIAGWRDNHIVKLPSGEVMAVYTDETKNKQAEELLKESEAGLRQSQEKLSIALKSIGDAVMVTDAEGKISFLNYSAQKLTGWPEKQAIGRFLDEVFCIINEKTCKKVVDPVNKVIKTGRIVGLGNHTVLIDRAGKKIAIEDSAAPIKNDQGEIVGVVLVFHDVSEKREADKKLEKISNALKVVGKCNEALIHIKGEQELLNEICKIIIDLGGYRFAWIGCAENDKNKTIRPVAQAGFERGYLRSIKITWANIKRGQGPTGTSIRTGKVVVCRDMLIDPRFKPRRKAAISRGYASSISLPFLIDRSVGVISVYASEPDAFNAEEIKLLSQLTNDLSYGIKNIRLNKERLEDQIKLKESEKKYYELFSRANDAIFIADPRSRKIVDCNKVAEKLTGYSRFEILSMKADELHPGDLLEEAMRGFKKQATGKVEQVFTEVLTKDNQRIPVSINTALVNIGGKKLIQGIFRDISEQKRAEEKLKESEEKFRKIFENSGMGVSLVGLDGRWLKVNKRLCEITGYSEKELLTKAYLQITYSEDVLKTKQFTKEIIFGKNKENFLEKRYINKKGHIIWVHLSISLIRNQDKKPLYFEVITEDITKQKKTEQVLRESEEKYRNLLSNLPKTEYILVHRGGKLLWVNDNVLSFLGYSREKIIGTSIFKYLEKEYKKIVSENIKRRMAGEIVGDYEIKVKNKKGQIVDVVVRGSVINYMGEPAVLLVLSDITELKKKDEAILKKNEFLDNIIDLNPNAIQIYDKTGHNFRVNKAYMNLFRFKGKTPPLENYNWFEDPVSKKTGLHEYQQLVKKGKTLEFREMAYNPRWVSPELPDVDLVFDVNVFPIMDSKNKLDKFVLMYQDITKRKATEEKIQANMVELFEKNIELDKFKLAVAGVSDHIVITNSDGVIIYANRAVEKITGYSLKEVIGNKPSLWGGQMPKEFYENFWKTIKKEKKLFVGEMTNKRKNGEPYIAEVKVSPILNNKREVQFFVGISHDITKAKELDRAKSEFISVASHQLKTPISGIKWMLESILQNRENNLTEKQITDLRDVYEDNEKMINLINDLLNISRIDSGKYATLNLSKTEIAPLIEKALKDLGQFAITRNVELEFKNKLPLNYSLNMDSDRIYQVILNLISNSIKYSKLEGGISKITTAIKNGEFLFSVKDNGIGIPIQNQRHIFEKFYRAENASASQANGSGLGLYIGKYFVESHKGKIWFKSKEGVGTTFAFTLRQDLI